MEREEVLEEGRTEGREKNRKIKRSDKTSRMGNTCDLSSLEYHPCQKGKQNPNEINLLTTNTYEIYWPNTLFPCNSSLLRMIYYS